MNKEDASSLLEEIIDILTEVGNGTTDKDLERAKCLLFLFRDEWFDKINYCKEWKKTHSG